MKPPFQDNLEGFQDAILCALAWATDNLGGGNFNLEELANSRDFYFEPEWIKQTIDNFSREGFINVYINSPPEHPLLSITPKGRSRVLEILHAEHSSKFQSEKLSDIFDRFDWFVLGMLMREASKPQSEGFLVAKQIQAQDPHNTEVGLIEARLATLEEYELIDHRDLVSNGELEKPTTIYRITPKGSYFVINNMHIVIDQQYGITEAIPDEIVNSLYDVSDWINNVVGEEHNLYPPDFFDTDIQESSVPASDRVVPLDHNSREYKEAVEAVDAVIDAVSGDNEYGDRAPAEKDAILSVLKAGRQLLDEIEARVSAVQATLLSALQYIADNFAKGAIAALGATAVAAVAKLLGIL